jgi:Domain of unknown function (DUF3480)
MQFCESIEWIYSTWCVCFQSEDVGAARGELDISRVSGNVARAFCVALEPLLDMLASAGLLILAVRITLHPEQVSLFSHFFFLLFSVLQ